MEKETTINDEKLTNLSRTSYLSNMAFDYGSEQEDHLQKSPSTILSSISVHDATGWYTLTKRGHQMNPSPNLTRPSSPTMQKDHWQQRRYNFLSKHSMLGGELKDEVIEQQDVRTTSDPNRLSIIKSTSMDCANSNNKRESIIGMAVTGVRQFLVANDLVRSKSLRVSACPEDDINIEHPNTSIMRLKNMQRPLSTVDITETDTSKILVNRFNEKSTQTENLLSQVVPTSRDEIQGGHENFKSKTVKTNSKDSKKKKLIETHESYRPYFTYWVTFVQIIVCIVSLLVYGHAPLTSVSLKNGTTLSLSTNPWFGPHPADLVRLGAKYTPCMRRHEQVERFFEKQSTLESISGCCVNSNTGHCMQTLSQQCSRRSSLVWYSTPLVNFIDNETNPIIYPAVCGLTPETCTKRITSNAPRHDETFWTSTLVDSKLFKWSPDAVRWPVCLEQDYSRIGNNISLYPHMQCTVIARPCCIGMLGDCVLTSKDDCQRRRGIFHSQANLCSQVDCIQSVCGMLEFFVARLPDQVYRFWTVIFIHAGLIHLLITVAFQYAIMRPLEQLAGCVRVMIIYVVSGFVGSLSSALFLRDSIQVGPGSGQFAILACYLSELFIGWRSLKRPWLPFCKILICLIIMFVVGLFPLVDNYSHCCGFIIGFLLNMIIFPDVDFRENVRRLVVVTGALTLTIAAFIVLIVLFYTVPFQCQSCQVFNCPLGRICNNGNL